MACALTIEVNQMQETNKLSFDDTYLTVYDSGDPAYVHTDTFATQKGFAQYVTDAAGRTARMVPGVISPTNVLVATPQPH